MLTLLLKLWVVDGLTWEISVFNKINLGENIFFILIDHVSRTIITWMTPFVLFLVDGNSCFQVAGNPMTSFCSFMDTLVTHWRTFSEFIFLDALTVNEPWCQKNKRKPALVSMKYIKCPTLKYLWGIFDLITDVVLVAFVFKCRWHVLCISTF